MSFRYFLAQCALSVLATAQDDHPHAEAESVAAEVENFEVEKFERLGKPAVWKAEAALSHDGAGSIFVQTKIYPPLTAPLCPQLDYTLQLGLSAG